MDGVLQPPLPIQGSWRPTAIGGLLTEIQSNVTRSAGADQSLKNVRSLEVSRERLTTLAHMDQGSKNLGFTNVYGPVDMLGKTKDRHVKEIDRIARLMSVIPRILIAAP